MVNRNGVAKPIFAMVCLVALLMSGFLSSEASAQQRCQETDPELFSILTNSIVQPYIPPLDRNGNTLLSDRRYIIRSPSIITLNISPSSQ